MNSDDILGLEWYFGGSAEADLGVRSVQGGFEDAMNRMAKSSCAKDWSWSDAEMPTRETRSTISASDDAIERLYNRRAKLDQARKIFARLRLLTPRDHAVLELHFGDIVRIQSVSVSLLCATTPVQEAVARVNQRRAAKEAKAGRLPPEPIGAREAVLRLHTSTSTAEQELLAELVGEAAGMLRAAVEAYEAMKVK
jgi:hypothetical protein